MLKINNMKKINFDDLKFMVGITIGIVVFAVIMYSIFKILI